MESTSKNRRGAGRSRRRLIAWLAFGAVGILMGAVWATGFASIGGATNGTPAASPAFTSGGASDQNSALAGLVTPGSNLSVTWTGRWGSTAATNFFKVDLDTLPAGQTYNVAMLLTNNISTFGWESLQLNVEQKDVGVGGSCATPGTIFDGTQNNKVMYFDQADEGVYWNGLAGGSTYCVGIAASNGQDTSGTFLRSATDSAPTGYPTFTATLDRAS
ncbi:MAG: hypothetical protein ACJ77M_13685 [Thermoleophilaceae bacterium]